MPMGPSRQGGMMGMASLLTPFLEMSSGRKWSSQIKCCSVDSCLSVSLRAASHTWTRSSPVLLQSAVWMYAGRLQMFTSFSDFRFHFRLQIVPDVNKHCSHVFLQFGAPIKQFRAFRRCRKGRHEYHEIYWHITETLSFLLHDLTIISKYV